MNTANIADEVDEETRPLCASQETLIALDFLYGRNSSWNQQVPLGFWITGLVTETDLKGALDRVSLRQSSLQAGIDRNPGVPDMEWQVGMKVFSANGMLVPGLFRQSLHPGAKVEIQYVQVPGSPDRASIGPLVSAAISTPFDFNVAPLWRAFVFQAENWQMLLLTFPQVMCDSWSLRIIHQDLRQALSSGRSDGPTLPFQFRDYAVWQRHQLTTSYFLPFVKYWRAQFDTFGEDTGLRYKDLPFSSPDKSMEGTPAESETVDLDGELIQSAEGQLPELILASLFAYLYQTSGKSKLALWHMFPNRSQQGTEHLVGYFAHLHLVGVEIPSGIAGGELLRQVTKQVENAGSHAEIHTSVLARKLGRVHRLGDAGLLFNSVDESDPLPSNVPAGDIKIERAVLPHIWGFRANAGLHITIAKRNSGYALISHFSPFRFRSESIRKMLRDVETIAMRIAEAPEEQISSLREGGPYDCR